jgi:hypothetical protein
MNSDGSNASQGLLIDFLSPVSMKAEALREFC